MTAPCFIGTSGFSYADWKGIFYPPEIKPAGYLAYYATRFNCIEINSCFYRIPRQSTIEKWTDSVPGDFKFCPKLYQGITHYRRFKNCEELLENYFEAFSPMKSKLGPILIQLPKSFAFQYDVVKAFFELLEKDYSEYQFAIETRHVSWYEEDALGLLSQYHIAHTISDAGAHHFPTHFAVTSDDIYLRFHGREQLYATDYKDVDLKVYAVLIKDWMKEGKRIFAFFNNTMHGYAINNALTLRVMVGEGASGSGLIRP